MPETKTIKLTQSAIGKLTIPPMRWSRGKKQKIGRMNRIKMAGQNPADSNCEVTEYMTLGELFGSNLAQRAHSQTFEGNPTRIKWGVNKVVLPTIRNEICNGGVLKAYGLTGGIRGAKHKLDDGETIRPDLAIIDDPASDKVANSQSQCEAREKLLSGAVMRLAGPGVTHLITRTRSRYAYWHLLHRMS